MVKVPEPCFTKVTADEPRMEPSMVVFVPTVSPETGSSSDVMGGLASNTSAVDVVSVLVT
jgi:hypothetical protein